MKALKLMPLAYLMGVHGFALFTPYLALVLSSVYIARRFRRTPQQIPVQVKA